MVGIRLVGDISGWVSCFLEGSWLWIDQDQFFLLISSLGGDPKRNVKLFYNICFVLYLRVFHSLVFLNYSLLSLRLLGHAGALRAHSGLHGRTPSVPAECAWSQNSCHISYHSCRDSCHNSCRTAVVTAVVTAVRAAAIKAVITAAVMPAVMTAVSTAVMTAVITAVTTVVMTAGGGGGVQ